MGRAPGASCHTVQISSGRGHHAVNWANFALVREAIISLAPHKQAEERFYF